MEAFKNISQFLSSSSNTEPTSTLAPDSLSKPVAAVPASLSASELSPSSASPEAQSTMSSPLYAFFTMSGSSGEVATFADAEAGVVLDDVPSGGAQPYSRKSSGDSGSSVASSSFSLPSLLPRTSNILSTIWRMDNAENAGYSTAADAEAGVVTLEDVVPLDVTRAGAELPPSSSLNRSAEIGVRNVDQSVGKSKIVSALQDVVPAAGASGAKVTA